jgi:hypothetical protein
VIILDISNSRYEPTEYKIIKSEVTTSDIKIDSFGTTKPKIGQ